MLKAALAPGQSQHARVSQQTPCVFLNSLYGNATSVVCLAHARGRLDISPQKKPIANAKTGSNKEPENKHCNLLCTCGEQKIVHEGSLMLETGPTRNPEWSNTSDCSVDTTVAVKHK